MGGPDGKRVVVIAEDDEPIAVLLRDAINDEHEYHAVIVSDGAVLIDTVHQVNADLIILDIMMPGLNGFEIFDRIRGDHEIRDMPVLFVSAATAQYDADFRKRGITEIVSKPFDLNELLLRIRTLCPPDAKVARG